MFICTLTYTQPIEAVDALLADHRAWLAANHAAGHFIAWGRLVPRVGGVIMAVGADKASVEALMATDPFVMGGVATVAVAEFAPAFVDPAFATLAVSG